jgi:hypothetical protein
MTINPATGAGFWILNKLSMMGLRQLSVSRMTGGGSGVLLGY